MPCFDSLIRHVGLIQDFIDRVLQVQDTGLIMSEKGVGSQIAMTREIHESAPQVKEKVGHVRASHRCPLTLKKASKNK